MVHFLKPPELRCQYKRNAYILANSFRNSTNHTNLLTGFCDKPENEQKELGRWPESRRTVERIKREISVQRLAEARGIQLKRNGKNMIGLCPFHDDKKPSLVITPGKNMWNCLGAAAEVARRSIG